MTNPSKDMPPLAKAPDDVIDPAGKPRLGRYAGPLLRVDLSRRPDRRPLDGLRRKRWIYALLSTPERICAVAIVDVGYAANAFAFVAAPDRGVLAQVSALGLPGLWRVGDRPEEGCDARFAHPRLRVRLSRPEGATAYRLLVEARSLSIDAVLETATAPPPLVAIADLSALGGRVNVTEKRALCKAAGVLRVGGGTAPLDDALAGIDYTQGILPRHTAWRWAFLQGRATDGSLVCVNLVEGWNGEVECAAWVGGAVFPLGEGRIHGDAENPLVRWRVQSACGAVDLSFQPFGLHAERRNLLLVRSRFQQPIGLYSGTLRLPGRPPLQLDGVPGVAEDQDVLW